LWIDVTFDLTLPLTVPSTVPSMVNTLRRWGRWWLACWRAERVHGEPRPAAVIERPWTAAVDDQQIRNIKWK